MSSSLFHDCHSDYDETYPKAIKVENDKSFGELKNGDKLYLLSAPEYKIVTLIVINVWHESKGHCYLTCVDDKNKKYNINFGSTYCANVIIDSKKSSIVHYFPKRLIGTNKSSLIKYQKNLVKEKIESLTKQLSSAKYYLNKLEKIEAL